MPKYATRLADLEAKLAAKRQTVPPLQRPAPAAAKSPGRLTLARPAPAPIPAKPVAPEAPKPQQAAPKASASAPSPARPDPRPAADPDEAPVRAWSTIELVRTWRSSGKAPSYWGVCDIDLPLLGLRLRELPVFWGLRSILLPSRPLLDPEGKRRINEFGRPMYSETVLITNRTAGKAFERALRKLLLAEFPELANPAPRPVAEAGEAGDEATAAPGHALEPEPAPAVLAEVA